MDEADFADFPDSPTVGHAEARAWSPTMRQPSKARRQILGGEGLPPEESVPPFSAGYGRGSPNRFQPIRGGAKPLKV